MDDLLYNEIELATVPVVKQAARDFAAALYESEPYQAFVLAASCLEKDSEAQEAIREFQEKQQSLQMMFRLNAVSPEDRSELERLHKRMLAQPSVTDYVLAQGNLTLLCQQLAGRLSNLIYLDYASACGASCCG
jgi:cell fate (sporulation/competence/biofilm development) regulator YlbF (YheA/YmcA/DUF963 family)